MRDPDLDRNKKLDQTGAPITIVGSQFSIDFLSKEVSRHSHNEGFIEYIETGAVEVTTDTRKIVLTAGSAFFIPAGIEHTVCALGNTVTGWYVMLPALAVPNEPKELTVLSPSPLFLELCRKVVSWGQDIGRNETQRRLEQALLDEFTALNKSEELDIPMPVTPKLISVAKRIVDNPSDMNSIDYWAEEAAMSRRSFTQYFKKETGLTFVNWRQRVKISAALGLIARQLSCSDIALQLGYKNTSAFQIMFKKHMGITPAKYRRMIKTFFHIAGRSKKPSDDDFLGWIL